LEATADGLEGERDRQREVYVLKVEGQSREVGNQVDVEDVVQSAMGDRRKKGGWCCRLGNPGFVMRRVWKRRRRRVDLRSAQRGRKQKW